MAEKPSKLKDRVSNRKFIAWMLIFIVGLPIPVLGYSKWWSIVYNFFF